MEKSLETVFKQLRSVLIKIFHGTIILLYCFMLDSYLYVQMHKL